jgi:hypothetical protein
MFTFWLEVIVPVVDIGEIVDHHCFFPVIISSTSIGVKNRGAC